MRDGALHTDAARLSPAAPHGARVLSVAAAIALHGAIAAVTFFFAPAPTVTDAPAIEVDLIVEEPALTAAPSGATETIEAAAEPEPAMPEPTPPEPTPPEPPVPEPTPSDPPMAEIADAPPAVEPPPEPPVETAAPREPALPMPPQRRPAFPSPPAAVAALRPEPPSAPVAAEAPAVAIVPPPPTAVVRPQGDYVGALLGWLERHKDYPRAARLRRIEGTAIVRLAILADGRLGALSLARSSGHAVLDEASLDMIRRAAPLPRPPGGAIDLDVPIVFSQSAR